MNFDLGFNTLMLLVVAFVLYFIPAFVADKRKHKNRTAIYALTLFLGWTVIGWIIALVWALTDNCDKTHTDQTPQKT